MANSEFLPHALTYGRFGFPTVPVIDKAPKHQGGRGWADGTCNPILLRELFSTRPHTGLGVPCGPKVGVVLDIDGEEGRQSLAELVEEFDFLPFGPTAITGRGQHRWFAWDDRCEILKNRVKFRAGLDIRTTGGGVVVPPSIHPDGGRYRWRDVSVTEYELPVAPDWLIETIASAYPRQEPKEEPRPIILHSRFAEGALALAVRRIEEETEGGRAARINGEAYGIGKNIVAPKLCEEGDAVAALVAAGIRLTGWPEKRVMAMVMCGLSAGLRDGELRHAV